MAITLDFYNKYKTTEMVDMITHLPNQFGYVNGQSGLFSVRSTNQKSIIFDKMTKDLRLLPSVNRGSRHSTYGSDEKPETFALKLAYFKHGHRLTAEDVAGYRRPGSTDQETMANALADKLGDIRRRWDETQEYMKIQAMKGVFKTPDGEVFADMFTEFGVTQTVVDFDLSNAATDVTKKVSELKRVASTAAQNGSSISGLTVLVDHTFIEKMRANSNFRSNYLYYAQNGNQVLRDSISQYMKWGVMEALSHDGVTFLSYNPSFTLPTGTIESAFATGEGIAFPNGVPDLFRTYYGPSNKFSSFDAPGTEMTLRTFMDPHDEFMEFEIESAPLHFVTRPKAIIKVVTSS